MAATASSGDSPLEKHPGKDLAERGGCPAAADWIVPQQLCPKAVCGGMGKASMAICPLVEHPEHFLPRPVSSQLALRRKA